MSLSYGCVLIYVKPPKACPMPGGLFPSISIRHLQPKVNYPAPRPVLRAATDTAGRDHQRGVAPAISRAQDKKTNWP